MTTTKRSGRAASHRSTSSSGRARSTVRSRPSSASTTAAKRVSGNTGTRVRKAAPKKTTRKAATKKTATKKTATKRAGTKKTATKRAGTKKTATKRAGTKKTAARTAAGKRPVARKAARSGATTRKPTARNSTARKSTTRKTTTRKVTARKASSTTRRKPAATTTSRRPATPRTTPTRRPSGSGPTRPRTSTAARTRRRAGSHRSGEDGVFGFTGGLRGSGRKKGRGAKLAPVTDAGERNAAYLTATVVGLTLFGLVMVLSASSVSSLEYADSPFSRFKMQAGFAAVGMVGFIIMSRVDYRRLRPLITPLLILTTGLLVLLLIPNVGTVRNGSSRWLDLGPIAVQPSELAKPVMILFVADLLARRERRMDRADLTVRPIMIVLVVLSTLMILQPKLGTPIIISAVTILMLFVAGAKLKSLGGWVAFAVGAATVLAIVSPYRRARLTSFLSPWESTQDTGFQAFQSQVGVASGGFLGTGLGASRSKWGYLPEVDTDFIFAVVAEEVGLLGASALIGGYVLLAWFGFKAAIGAPDRFGALLATGITSWLLIQAFLNIGMVLGVLPITGEPLPLISRGGSSLMATLAAAGLLTSVSRRAKA